MRDEINHILKAGDLIWSSNSPFLVVGTNESDVKILSLEKGEVFFLNVKILHDLQDDEMIQIEKS